MKKILIIVLVLIFAGAVLSRNAFAAEEEQIREVDYELPYPGMLPDSPLYFFKNVRDQAMGMLVMGPVNKAFYNLFMADKRLWAGQMLIESGNNSLGATTLYVSEEYFANAVNDAKEAQKSGMKVSDLGAKLLVSSAKHDEVLENVAANLNGDSLATVQKAQTLNVKSRNRVIGLTSNSQ